MQEKEENLTEQELREEARYEGLLAIQMFVLGAEDKLDYSLLNKIQQDKK